MMVFVTHPPVPGRLVVDQDLARLEVVMVLIARAEAPDGDAEVRLQSMVRAIR